MVFPLYDDRASETVQGFRPWATWGLIVCNVIVFLYVQIFPWSAIVSIIHIFGLLPADLVHSLWGEPRFHHVRPELTLITHMFLHTAWWHLLGNLLVLRVFGDDVEKATGHLRFLLLYFLAGVAGGLAHMFSNPDSTTPLIGASGAIAGVFGAYILLRPRAKIVLLLAVVPVRISALWLVAIWLALQLLGILVPKAQGEVIVSYWGHLGGFLAGSLALLLLRRPDVPLLGPASSLLNAVRSVMGRQQKSERN